MLIVITGFLFFSCAQETQKEGNRIYDKTVNRQFWTADWSSDGKYIAVGGVDSLLRIFDDSLKVRANLFVNSWIHVVKWNPDGKTLAIGTLNNYVLIWNTNWDKPLLLPFKGGTRAMDWNHDGTLLAVGDLDGNVQLWNRDGSLVKTIEQSYGSDAVGRAFTALDWHPFENRFVAGNFRISIFDTSGKVLKELEHQNKEAIILSTAWHPEGSFFVIGDYGHNWEGENVPSLLHYWNENGEYIKSIPGSKGEYRNIAWSKKSGLLATASDVLRIWNKEGNLLHESAPDASNYLWGISWSPNGERLVTASRHKTIAIWDRNARLLNRVDVQ